MLVETLTGSDDRIGQAQALAIDCAGEQTADLAGRRESDPLPRPELVAALPLAA